MADLRKLDSQERSALSDRLNQRYEDFKAQNLSLDMTRGKPSPEQLDLSLDMLSQVTADNYTSDDNTDCRNYGGVDGLPQAKILFADFMEVATDEIIIGGNASLTLMHDTVLRAFALGVSEDMSPWSKGKAVKFICPVPGYDRHFSICEFFGIDMLPVAMDPNGPLMDTVEKLVAEDASIKGIWCVPKYSNPSGAVYSDETVDRLANMATAAEDFRVFWDNAYAYHPLYGEPAPLKNILTACTAAGNPDRVIMFGSTSKISFSGSGIAVMAASRRNIDFMRRQISFQTIGPDKLNQLRHIRFFKNMDGIRTHMQRHAALLGPKFRAVDQVLEAELQDKGVARWTRPQGGYFVSIDTPAGCAAAVVKMAAEAGVKLTPAGATHPYGKDPEDRTIRIAPSFPQEDDIRTAMAILAVCIQIAALKKMA
jgi:DNA-binding transcriptional MocR family regulator